MFDGTIKPESIDLTITSPPYDNLRSYNNSSTWGYAEFYGVASGLWRVIKPGGVVVWVVNDATVDGSETGTSFEQIITFKKMGFNLHDTMIYQTHKQPGNYNRYQPCFEFMFVLSKGKPNTFNPILVPCIHAGKKNNPHEYFPTDNHIGKLSVHKSHKFKENIWLISSGTDKKGHSEKLKKHPARFPEVLAKDHIISWSNEGDVVFDPFMGSGTTGKMALINKRNFIGCEIDKTYFKMSYERIKNSRGILYKDVKILTKGFKRKQ
jgi:site-specific DNA-methyltransferase (adenine-specific)